MSCGFSCRCIAVVTAGTGAGNGGMVYACTGPAGGSMAGIAALVGLDMAACLSHGNRAIVTAGAGTAYVGMIDAHHRIPHTGAMAGFATG